MSQTFSVNGKEYILSSTLAASSGYSSDYIGKLAREEKILGALIGRQWFIEPESLKVFLQKTAIEKEIRKEELSRERKLTHAATQSTENKRNNNRTVRLVSPSALAETFIIVVCGLFVGGLGWVITAEQIGIQEISKAGMDNIQLVVESISYKK